MLATFVIGLREGLEAALIVGIVAAFLVKSGRRDALRPMWVGVLLAVVLCTAAGVTLQLVSSDLPQVAQERFETVIGVVAVGMVTWMITWMRRHAKDLRGALEGAAASALAGGSTLALVAMAFLAVLREGLETSVFVLAVFQSNGNTLRLSVGVLLGLFVAVGLGYAIYRGGTKINLSKFFRATGLVLVLVAAGLVANAFHTAHEGGWINVGQSQALNLSSVIAPGTVRGSIFTGVFGVQPRPVTLEVIGWLVYAVPLGLYVAWPQKRRPSKTVSHTQSAGAASAATA